MAVAKNKQGKGIGQDLITACLGEAKVWGQRRFLCLPISRNFLKSWVLNRLSNADLPHKIWAECINCCKFPNCQEIALLKICKITFLCYNSGNLINRRKDGLFID